MGRPRRDRPPTILDIARETGVSKSAVSLALRGADGVSDETRRLVQDAAARLGYRSNAVARALVQGRTMQIGVITTDLRNPYHLDVALGVERAANDHGFSTLIAHGERSSERVEQHLEAMLALNVEGVVVVSSRLSTASMSRASASVPLVVVGRLSTVPTGVDTVSNQDTVGGRLAAEHLHGLGHRTLAFVSRSQSPAALARAEGFIECARSLGDTCTHVASCSADELLDTLDGLFDDGVTAIAANNDLTAVAILGWAHARNVRVPDDLSLVGYDNSLLARTVTPRLTSLDQAAEGLGAEAMALLHDRLSGRTGRARRRVVEPTLCIRSSTAPPTDRP